MTHDTAELLAELRTRGLIGTAEVASADAAITSSMQRHARPLAIGLLLGASGWAAGLCLLVFAGALFRPGDAGQAALIGAVLLAAAWGLFKVDHDGEVVFVAQLALTLSIAGQCLLLYAMTKQTHGIAPIAASALVLQTLLALLMPSRLHRTLSTLFAAIAWALTLRFGLFDDSSGLAHENNQNRISLPGAMAVWLLGWGPIAAALAVLVHREADWMARGWQAVVRPIGDGLIIGLAFATLASQPFESLRWFGREGAAGLAIWPLLSAGGALLAVAAAFALRQRSLLALSAAAVLLHLAHFYYTLGTTLLSKSLLMLVMGAVLLLAARLLVDKETR